MEHLYIILTTIRRPARVKSYLVASGEQRVHIGPTPSLCAGEPILLEISQKYSLTEIQQLAEEVGV